jgi:hypothetical protein
LPGLSSLSKVTPSASPTKGETISVNCGGRAFDIDGNVVGVISLSEGSVGGAFPIAFVVVKSWLPSSRDCVTSDIADDDRNGARPGAPAVELQPEDRNEISARPVTNVVCPLINGVRIHCLANERLIALTRCENFELTP